jgi:hypothetical protein
VLFAAALVLAGVATAIGYSRPAARPELVGGNTPINPNYLDRSDNVTHNSPTVVRNPRQPANLAVVNRIDTPRFSCALHVSFDGGGTWAPTTIPFPEGEEAPPRCFAPDAAFAADGTLHVSFVTLAGAGNVPNAVWLTRSTDGGRTLAPPERRLGRYAFQVRLTADPNRAGTLYMAWLQATDTATFAFPTTGNPILTARSDDGGATWSAPVQVNPRERERVVAPSVAVGPRGQLYVLYLDLRDDRLDYSGAHEGLGGIPDDGPWELVLARSVDGGASWRESAVDRELVPIERFIVFIPPLASLAVDGASGRVYAAFHDGRDGDADVRVWASDDQGVTFGPGRRVNDTPLGDGTWQYLPKLAVAPDGRVDVVYYDRRGDRANLFNDVSFQSSGDGGRTFGPRLRLSGRSFDSRIGFGRDRGLADLGNRLGLVSTSDRALAVWADSRLGADRVKQDLGMAVVDFPEPSTLARALRIGGPVVGIAALGLLVWWAGSGRRQQWRSG